jgi:tRNA 2-selenouridine synthase
MIVRISIEEYLKIRDEVAIIDVRSPAEFEKGHIPGAHSVPLFDNEERAIIGTIYKKQSKEAAIARGYDFVNPKLDWYISESEKFAPNKIIAVHCWRGGMRSGSFAQHLSDNGFEKVYVIEGGYKAFRNFTFNFFDKEFKLIILGGYTGSGKTEILEEISKLGKQVVDLEGLARHKGSAFGWIGQGEQPAVEHFQNLLFMEMYLMNHDSYIWLEDESFNIGKVVLPKNLFDQMRSSRVYFLDIPRSERAKFLMTTYGVQEIEDLKTAVNKVSKRLGPLNTKISLEALDNGDLLTVAELTLIYYDKSYRRGVENRDANKITELKLDTVNHKLNAETIVEFVEQNIEE